MEQHWKELVPVDRYIVRSTGLIHDYDRKILTLLYQPLIGSKAYSLYMMLWGELEHDRLWGEESTHHTIMAIMQSNLKDVYNERLKLEGIGLLKTYVNQDEDSRLYIYELQPPLNSSQFFTDGVLNVFLYNRLGKNNYKKLKNFFSDSAIDMDHFTPMTKSFSDVFRSIHPSEMITSMNGEMGQNLESEHGKEFVSRTEGSSITLSDDVFDFDLFFSGLSEVIIPKRSITQKVKEAIKKLAFLYAIDTIQMKNIVMSALDHNESIDIEVLRKSARDWYQFENGDSLPNLSDKIQPLHYRKTEQKQPKTREEQLIVQLETISPKKLLIDLSGGAAPSSADLHIIEDVMFHQKLLPGVVNVLIYYVMLRTDMKLSKAYVEKIASHWARKNIHTVEDAMKLAKQEHRQYQDWAKGKKQGTTSRKKAIRKEILPDWLQQEDQENEQPPQQLDNFDEEKRKLEERIKKYKDKPDENSK